MACMVLFGWTVDAILEAQRWRTINRDLHVVELWCGVMSIVAAAHAGDLTAQGFDIARVPGLTDDPNSTCSEDILSQHGFENAVSLVMRLLVNGLLFMAPVCSSWIFANSSNTHRKAANVNGNLNYKPVADGNRMADVAAFLVELGWRRRLAVCIENPASSLLFKYAPILEVVQKYSAVVVNTPRCAFSTEAFGERYYKLYKFAAFGPPNDTAPGTWIQATVRSCACPFKKHVTLMHRLPNGQVSGKIADLQRSAAYPVALGHAIVAAWQHVGAALKPDDAAGGWRLAPRSVIHDDAESLPDQPAWLQPESPPVVLEDVSPKSGKFQQKPDQPAWLQPESPPMILEDVSLKSGKFQQKPGQPAWLQPESPPVIVEDVSPKSGKFQQNPDQPAWLQPESLPESDGMSEGAVQSLDWLRPTADELSDGDGSEGSKMSGGSPASKRARQW